MSIYSDMQQITSELLTEFDQSNGSNSGSDGLWYIQVVPVTSDRPDKPSEPSLVPHKLFGVSRGVSQKYVDGSNITASDLQCTVAVSSKYKPDVTGFVDVDGVRHKIVEVFNIPPTGVTVANILVYRK